MERIEERLAVVTEKWFSQIRFRELSIRYWTWPMRGLSRSSKESSDGGGSVGYDGILFFI